MSTSGLDSADAYPSPSDLLSRLALRAAHDLNNLIAVISGHVYLLRSDLGSQAATPAAPQGAAATAESLDAIQAAVAGLERLSRSLSAVGAAHGAHGPVDVAALVRAVAGETGTPPAELELEPGLPAVAGNADALRAALRALLRNAAEAAPAGHVRVAARRQGDAVVLSVEDRGIGLSPDAAKRAFEPFFSTRGVGRGTGIGLFVAAAVASAHGASCRLEPREGGGMAASIRLSIA